MSEDLQDQPDRRKYLRFHPDKGSLIQVLNDEDETEVVGLMRDESYEGVSGVFHEVHFDYEEGDVLDIHAGKLGPMEAEIVWVDELGDRFVLVGMECET